MSMKQLSSETIKLISSTQVITSASSVVKELLENSIDAGATTIDIRLDNYGLDKIEIRDNGVGISHSDVQVMCLRSYTSKIFDVSDLDKLTCYGFRGEALSSICAVADVTIITKSEFDKYARSFTIDNNGQVINSSISHHQKGTVIKVVDLFKKLPVRKQMYSSKKHCVNDLRKIEYIVKSLTAIQENVRVLLIHNKSVLWQMAPVNDLTIKVGLIWSSSMTKYVKQLKFSSEEVEIDIVLPAQNIDVQNCFFTTNLTDAIYLYINKRPVRDSKIEKLIVAELSNYFGHYLPPGKYLPCLVSLTVPPETIDINLEPDKSRILLHNQEIIISNLKNCIQTYYYNDKVEIDTNQITASPTNKITASPTNKITSSPKNKRKMSFDSEVKLKKPTIFMSQTDNSFAPNAESTKIINSELFDSETNNDEHSQIIKELSLEEIDFEEPISFSSKENPSEKICLENNKSENVDDISEYRKRIMNIGNNIQSDNTNVINFNAENISISQWSKGDVVLNGKAIEGGVSVKTEILHTNLENCSSLEIETKKLQNDKNPDKTENITSIQAENKSTESISNISTSSSIRLAPLFRTVSVPDEQVPGLNHFVSRPQSWVPQPRSKRPSRDTSDEDLSDTIRSVSSQMGNKEMSGFTFFAKEMRIKILQENPGMDFTKVSKELARSWGCLSKEEKENYKKLANERKKVNLKRYSTKINIELSEIKRNVLNKQEVHSSEFTLIGEVEENWICCVRNKVNVINICRLQEAIIFFQKMANDAIPLKILDEPIIISKKYLGEGNYRFLMDLDTSYEPSADKYTITDERIVKNGFNVVIEFIDDSENPVINISDVALHISTYGDEELKKLLELMQTVKEDDLHCCRPLKVVNYLRSETVRQCKYTGLPKTKDEINKLLDYWFINEKSFSHNKCVHHKQVFTPLFDM